MLTNADYLIASHSNLLALESNFDLGTLLTAANIRSFANHEQIYRPGDGADSIFVVTEGCVQIYRHNDEGRRAVLTISATGDAFGIGDVLDNTRRRDTAEVIRHCRVLEIPAKAFMDLLKTTPEMAVSVARYLSACKREITDRLEQIQLKPTTERLAEFLLQLAPGQAQSTDIVLPCEKSVIASYLGMKPESFSRSLKELKSYGVSNRGRRVHIEDRERLSLMKQAVAS
jgi:CRP/FNR family transcriptional regulator, dissimilatory nitrate respiration regulator